MKTFDGIAQAADAVRAWFYANQASLPAFVVDKLTPYVGTGASPVDLVVNFTEVAYANADTIGDEAKELATGTATLAESFGFHGMNQDSRGSRIAKILDGQTVAAASTPEPKTELVLPEEPAEEE